MHSVRDCVSSLSKGELLNIDAFRARKKWLTSAEICPFCGSAKIDDILLPKNGIVLAFALQNVVPEKFEGKAPYVIAVIQLSDGSKLQARIEDYQKSFGNIISRNASISRDDTNDLVFALE